MSPRPYGDELHRVAFHQVEGPFDEFAHLRGGRNTRNDPGEFLVAQAAGHHRTHGERFREPPLATDRDHLIRRHPHRPPDEGTPCVIRLARHHEDDATRIDGRRRGAVGRMDDGRVEATRHDVDDEIAVENRIGTVRGVHCHSGHGRVYFPTLDIEPVEQYSAHLRLDALPAGPRPPRDLHPQRGRMLGQRPANQPPCLRIELFDLRGEVVPQLPRHDPPIVGGDCRRETADGQPNECFPEKTLWPLRSLPPHTLGIRDNGRVNEADQHTTETLDERPTRGNRLYPRVTSFRSRRGSLTDPQQQCWDRRWPELGKEVGDEPLDVDAWFGRSAPLVLEIGSGTGTAAVAMAAAEPEVNLIAVEVYKPGIAQTLQAVERTYDTDAPIENLRILRGDAVEVLEKMLTSESLTGVRVFFPDPWPKARHHKRRLLQAPTFALIADRLKPGGVLHVATDHAEYAEAIAEVGDAEPRLARFTGTAPISLERPVTKFEDKAHQVGSAINEFVWGKIGA